MGQSLSSEDNWKSGEIHNKYINLYSSLNKIELLSQIKEN